MQALVSVNGVISPPEEARVSVFDRGFLFGDAVYETGSAKGRCCLFLEEHLERLRRSASKLSIPIPWKEDELRERLYALARAFGQPDLYFRIIVTRGIIDHVALEAFSESEPTLVMVAQTLTDMSRIRQEGVNLLTSSIIRNSSRAQDPNIKTSNYLNSLLALQDVRKRGGEDAVLCNADGFVTEGTTFCVFGFGKNGLITPSLESGILDSITRRHILKLARTAMPVEEGLFPLKRFLDCEETFIASSIREMVPVKSWDGRAFPTPGPRTKALYDLLRGDIDSYVATHGKF